MQPVFKHSDERGSVLIEFLFSTLIWVPLLLGTIVFSINLIRAIQLSQLARDSGHMYAQGIDFSQPQNAAILSRQALGVSIKPAGATPNDGAIVLSTITLVTQQECAAANLKVCPNNGRYVFTSLYVFGNQTYVKTKFGNPSAYLKNGANVVPENVYLTDPTLEAKGFSSLLQFPNQPGQYAYVSEVTANTQVLNWSDFSNTGSYARSIF